MRGRTSILELYEIANNPEWHTEVRRANVLHLCRRLHERGYTIDEIRTKLQGNCPPDQFVMEAFQEFLDSLGVE